MSTALKTLRLEQKALLDHLENKDEPGLRIMLKMQMDLADRIAVDMEPDGRTMQVVETAIDGELRELVAVTEAGSGIVGSASLAHLADNLLLSDLFVVAANRRRGIGSSIVRYAIARSKALGQPLYLYVSPGDWRRAWYERMGFEATGELTAEGYVWMRYTGAKCSTPVQSEAD